MGTRYDMVDIDGLAPRWGIGECGDCGGTIVLGESTLDGLCAECAADRVTAPLPQLRVVYSESADVMRLMRMEAA